MTSSTIATDWWPIELEGMPHFEMAMKRVYAWYESQVLDRAPVRFIAHNADFDAPTVGDLTPEELKVRWFDEEYQVDQFLKSVAGKRFHGETFPIFSPNLGPDVYAAFYGAELEYGEVTSWSHPYVTDWDDMARLRIDKDNAYFRKIEDLTRVALEKCDGKFLVGYTDIHPGEDCAMAWRGSTQLCLDVYEAPEKVEELMRIASADFHMVFDHFDAMLKAARQPSSTWIGVPSFGKMHVPSCDWSAMISPEFFERFSLPILREEVKPMTHNIYHVDGPGVARHLDMILSVPEVHAIQWVQGLGKLQPIMQWLSLIEKVQAAGRAIIVDLQPDELDEFIAAVRPEGIYLWLGVDDEEEQMSILRRLEKWT